MNSILDNFMEGSPKELFKVWHYLFKKSYTLDTQLARQRFAIFKDNLKMIREHNSKGLLYTLGLNQFTDMTNEEFKASMSVNRAPTAEQIEEMRKTLQPASFLDDEDDDLTKRNLAKAEISYIALLPAARDQKLCGSCWAFSTAATIEGNWAKKTGKTATYLSTQQLIDCDKGNNGCKGGTFGPSFDYVKKNGLQPETTYPYKAALGICTYSQPKVTVKTTGQTFCSNYMKPGDCTVDKVYALLQQGPGSIGIDSGPLQSYRGGLFTATCNDDNHAVVLAGYGVTKGVEYWLVRNSWGGTWGENGYVKVAINESNKHSCFVNNEVYIPIF
jgi:C1A family cysteine protease